MIASGGKLDFFRNVKSVCCLSFQLVEPVQKKRAFHVDKPLPTTAYQLCSINYYNPASVRMETSHEETFIFERKLRK